MMKMELKDSNQVDIFGPNYEKKISKQYIDPNNGVLTYDEQCLLYNALSAVL